MRIFVCGFSFLSELLPEKLTEKKYGGPTNNVLNPIVARLGRSLLRSSR